MTDLDSSSPLAADDGSAELLAAVSRELGVAIAETRSCAGDGWTATSRLLVRLADGRRCFIKHALTDATADWLRTEAANYRLLSARPLAHMIGFVEGDRPALVLEDLSGERWPPPWSADDLVLAHAALDDIAADPAASSLPPLPERLDSHGGWAATDTSRLAVFLAPGLDAETVAQELDKLAGRARALGQSAVLLDARTGNVCLGERGAVWIDLDGMSRGNTEFAHALLDISASSRRHLTPKRRAAMAHVAGAWAERLPEPSPSWAPQLRRHEAGLLRNALRLLLDPPPHR